MTKTLTDYLLTTTALPLIWAELMATYAQRPERRVNEARDRIVRTVRVADAIPAPIADVTVNADGSRETRFVNSISEVGAA